MNCPRTLSATLSAAGFALAPIVPEAVMTHEDGLLSVAYGNLVGVLIEAVKELADQVERLEART